MNTLATPALLALALLVSQSPRASVDTSALFAALEIQRGQTVGEIGAGNGELTLEVARLVGAEGRVFTSELGERRISGLQRAVKNSGLTQVTVIEGAADATNFPDACCDAIFMRNVYHHFADPAAMNASILRALKPGGHVAIVDFEPSRGRREAARPAERASVDRHGTTSASVARELEAAGFKVVRTDPGANRWFMIVAARAR
jgi:ubiquinone/menaquinone biosynthesis C-methylase UbiE